MATPFAKLGEQVQCPVCLDVYKQPKILDCHHALCLDCIDNLVSIDDEEKESIDCPTCRKSTKLPKNGTGDLPPAFYLNTLLELHQATQSSPHCIKHDRPLDMFCVDCQITVCAKCFFATHHDHNGDFVADVIDQYKQEVSDHLTAVKQRVSHVLSIIDKLSTQETAIAQRGEKVKKEIDELVQEVIQAVQQSGAQLKKNVDEIIQKESSKISKQREDRQVFIEQLNNTIKHVEEKLQSKSSKLLKEKKKMIKKLKNISEEAESEDVGLKEPIGIIFQRKQGIIVNTATIGNILLDSTTLDGIADHKSQGRSTVHIKQLSHQTFKQITAIKGIKKPRGIAIPSGGVLVVAESESNALAVIQSSNFAGGYSKPKRIPLQEGACPEAICTTADGHILVVGNAAPYVTKYKTDYSTLAQVVSSASSIGQYQYHWVRDIAMGPSGQAYISDWNNHCIHVLCADLTVSQSIGKRGSKPGQFKWPLGIAVKLDTVYVCDRDNSRIQKLSVDGEYLGEFDVSSHPQHIAIDNNNVLYITSDDGMLTAYTVDGDRLAQIVLKDYDNIAVDEQGLIYVCNFNENKIAIFNGLL